jgi:hypothetical protein
LIERPDPDALLAGPLGQWLAAQDEARATAKATSRRRMTIGIVAGLAIGLVVLAVSHDAGWTMTSAMLCFGLGAASARAARRAVTNTLKQEINGAIAEALGLRFSVAATPGEPFDRACRFGLLPSYDRSGFEDEWSGTVAGQRFVLHEAKLTEQRGSGKDRRTVTVFEGCVLSIGFARDFIGTTLVERDDRHRGWFGGQKQAITAGDVRLERVDMVDPSFEDAFAVWSSDGVEARYLVHPAYVERLIAVEQAYAGKAIRALFHAGDLLIVLENADLFESGSLDASDDRPLLERTIAQFTALADLAQQLNERPRATFN